MIQSRISSLAPLDSPPLHKRSLDIAFFGLMTPRRAHFLESLSKTSLVYKFEREKRADRIVRAYSDAKVCCILQSYSNVSGGEYHRLSDISQMGCMLVMERVADSVKLGNLSKAP